MSPVEKNLVELADRELVIGRRIQARRWLIHAMLLTSTGTWLYSRLHVRALLVAPVFLVGLAVATVWTLVAERRARMEHTRVLARIPEPLRVQLGLR